MNGGTFRVRTMGPEEVPLAVEWAATEGWNPGLADAACFAAAAPGGFLLGELAGAPAATFSVVNYDEHFSFVGFYIVRSDLRRQGFGLNIWQTGMARAGSRAIGLDGVVAQQENYRKSGFEFAYNNIRYGGWVSGFDTAPTTVSLAEVPFDLIARDWAAKSARCSRKTASQPRGVFAALVGTAGGKVFIDVPQPNDAAVALATAHGFTPVFETARMYSGPIRQIALERVYGVTTFEVG